MAKSKARTDLQRAIDDILTGRINNQLSARMFILKGIGKLSSSITERFGDIDIDADERLVQVYIKGNSALNLYKMNNTTDQKKNAEYDKKWSDFDNQIVINPFLPKVWWYEILNQIHDLIKVDTLPEARDGFFISEQNDKSQTPENIYDGAKTLKNIDITIEELKEELGDDFKKFPAIAKGVKIEHQLKMQSNVLLCLSSEYLHPVNYFDNIRTLMGNPNSDIDFMDPEHSEANEYFPPAVAVLKDFKGKKVKKDSSIWINTTIGKFLLYRLIVRYKKPGLSYDGTVKREDVNAEAVKFRGEVIDISIPRRESEETLNQWVRFGNNIEALNENNPYRRKTNKSKTNLNRVVPTKNPKYLGPLSECIRIPDFEYQLEENINMINEVLTDTSGSPHKFYKRLKRGNDALEQIETISNQNDKHPLHANAVFKESLDLKALYNKSTQAGIKCFFKQFSRTLRFDYFTPLLDSTISDKLKKVFPTAGASDLEFNQYSQWYEGFKVYSTSEKTTKVDAKDVIVAKFKAPTDQTKMKQLLMCTHVGHEINQFFKKTFNLTFDQLKIVNTLRDKIDKAAPDNQKCYFDGILSAKLDSHLRLGEKWAEDYPLPIIPLYLVRKNEYKLETLQQQTPSGWSAKQATEEQLKDYGYNFFLTNKEIPHILVIKVLPANENDERNTIEQQLEELLVWQHGTHQLLINRADNMLNCLYTLISKLKKPFDLEVEESEWFIDTFADNQNLAQLAAIYWNKTKDNTERLERVFKVMTELKQYIHSMSQRSNILFCTEKFAYFIAVCELLLEMNLELEKITKTTKENDVKQVNGELNKLTPSLQSDNYQQKDNLYNPLGDYLTVTNKMLKINTPIDAKKFFEDVAAVINELTKQLKTLVKSKKQNLHAAIFSSDKNSRLLVGSDEALYRVLRPAGIAQYIDHRIAMARDFYLIHWLDHNRIHYKMHAVSYTTHLTNQAKQIKD